jgi:tRNA(Ile2) C34 agmatinyltransferase TiaS
VILVGIDDTDVVGSPGTNQLARAIVARLGRLAQGTVICRHQLFFDPRVPYTSKNGSASIQLPRCEASQRAELIAAVREVMTGWYVEGSDPGLCVASGCSAAMTAFSSRAKVEVVEQEDARAVAAAAGCHLEGLGGTEQGIIGALAAVALAHGGNDGRVVHVDGWPYPDDFGGVREVEAIVARGVDEVRELGSGEGFAGRLVDVGKRLRPSWRDGRIVLYVEPPDKTARPWRAVKLL